MYVNLAVKVDRLTSLYHLPRPSLGATPFKVADPKDLKWQNRVATGRSGGRMGSVLQPGVKV